MGAYINKDLKELIITLASVIGFGDVLVKTGRLHQRGRGRGKTDDGRSHYDFRSTFCRGGTRSK